jgi:hypothetical protein
MRMNTFFCAQSTVTFGVEDDTELYVVEVENYLRD